MDSTKPPIFIFCFSVLLCFFLIGCGGGQSPLPKLVQGTGTVTLDGKPLDGATITFNPKEGGASFAFTDQDGKFTLMFNKDTPGVIPGKHIIKIVKEKNPDVPGTNLVPAKYSDKSKLTADVKNEEPNEFQFDLTSK